MTGTDDIIDARFDQTLLFPECKRPEIGDDPLSTLPPCIDVDTQIDHRSNAKSDPAFVAGLRLVRMCNLSVNGVDSPNCQKILKPWIEKKILYTSSCGLWTMHMCQVSASYVMVFDPDFTAMNVYYISGRTV